VFCSDDQLFLQPVRFADMKPLHYGDLTNRTEWKDGHSWWQRMRSTRDALISRGISAVKNYDSHCPTPFDRDKFLATVPTYNYTPPPGHTINTLYVNAAGVEGEPVRGRKHSAEAGCEDVEKIREAMNGKWYLGYNDPGLTEAMKQVLAELFPARSRFEADCDCPVCSIIDPIPEPELQPVPRGWANEQAVKDRHIAAFRDMLQRQFEPPKNLSGDGIVICGEGKFWPGIVVAVKLLRELGCKLPVQVWHNGPIGDELNDDEQVKLIDARGFRKSHPARILRGWEIKTYAILHSGLSRVLYLDADAYCVVDPTPMFSLLDDSRFVFWNDLSKQKNRVKWDWYGVQPNGTHSVQGGQLLINLKEMWREVVLAHWLNQHSDYYYTHQYGDQDSWKVALATSTKKHTCLGTAIRPSYAKLLILSSKGIPCVVHRTNEKLWPNKKGNHPRTIDEIPLESRVQEMYRDLFCNAVGAFGHVYRSAAWGTKGGGSGSGSTESALQPYLELIHKKLSGVERVIDLGCGSGIGTRKIIAQSVVGIDVFRSHIERLRKECPDREWVVADINQEKESLPSGDVALLKDVLQHWPSGMVIDLLNWAKHCGKWTRIYLTQDNIQNEADCPLGGYRGLDLKLHPLNQIEGIRHVASYAKKSILSLDLT
jgi:ribosomal protein L11 methylase PrmA